MQAQEKPYLTGRTFLFSILKGEDLLQTIEEFCIHHDIQCGFIQGIGAIDQATFGIYNQKTKKYIKITKKEEMEILSLSGNVSLFDDRPMTHTHITLSDSEGKTWGGHLMSGTRVFSAEIFIQELSGDPKNRKKDKATQLSLWANPVALR
ncbi:MAG: DNA-binding protein [Elusimicrobiales bacterium]|nr:DNA-binding protein [Elusimicrobiales bacterium]